MPRFIWNVAYHNMSETWPVIVISLKCDLSYWCLCNVTCHNDVSNMWPVMSLTCGLLQDKIIWNPVAMNNSDIPISECGDRCVVGHAKVVTTPHCCWKCKVCNEKEKVAVHYPASSCKACPDKTWPDKRTRTHCVPIPPSHIELGSLNGNLLFALSLLVVVFSCVISVVYVIKRNSSFIGAIGLYNSLAMVAGHVVCSLLGLLFVQKPAFNSCVLTLAVFHLSFTFTYGGMLAMCLRLYDLHLQESGASKTKCDNSGVQLMIFAIIVALQVSKSCLFFLSLSFMLDCYKFLFNF